MRLRARVGEIGDLGGDRLEPLGVSGTDNGCEQSLVVEVDGDAEVDGVMDDQLVVADAGVQVGELAEPVDDRP